MKKKINLYHTLVIYIFAYFFFVTFNFFLTNLSVHILYIIMFDNVQK